MINYNAALPAGNYPASKSSINVTDWIQGIKGNLSYLIRQAFRGGEVGFAYDPNDLTTLYQDAAGTIPVTAAGQPVSLVLDKSKGLALESESIVNGTFESGLQYTSKFDGSGSASTWTLNTNQPISGSQDGLLTVTTAGSARPGISFTRKERTVVGAVYELSFDYSVKSGTIILSNVYTGGETVALGKTLSGKGKFSTKFRCAGESVEDVVYFGGSLGAVQIDNFSVKRVLGNHAYQTDSACKPKLQRNATTGAYYLAFDGVDDFLQTNNIDFTSTDKVSLFAGVRKLSDANTAVVAEISTTSDNGKAFTLFAPALLGIAKFLFRSGGSSVDLSGGAHTTDTKYSAPFTVVAVGRAKISMDYMSLKLNGAVVGDAITDQGTGNYGNYPLYIGRRAGTSHPFNGHLYSLIGIGRLTTDAETIALEKSIAKNTGVTL